MTDGQTDDWTDEWTDIRMKGWIDGQMRIWTYTDRSVQMDRQMYGWTDKWIDKWTDGWTYGKPLI